MTPVFSKMIPNQPRLEAGHHDPLRRDDLLAHWKATKAAGPDACGPTLRREVTLEVAGGVG